MLLNFSHPRRSPFIQRGRWQCPTGLQTSPWRGGAALHACEPLYQPAGLCAGTGRRLLPLWHAHKYRWDGLFVNIIEKLHNEPNSDQVGVLPHCVILPVCSAVLRISIVSDRSEVVASPSPGFLVHCTIWSASLSNADMAMLCYQLHPDFGLSGGHLYVTHLYHL